MTAKHVNSVDVMSDISMLILFLWSFLFVIKFVSHRIVRQQTLEDTPDLHIDLSEKNIFFAKHQQRHYTSRPNYLYSTIMGIYGFTKNTLIDIVTAFACNEKLKKWIRAGNDFKSYLFTSGIDDEIGEAFLNPRVIGNIVIMARIQDTKDANTSLNRRRVVTAFKELPTSFSSFYETINDATCYCKYATAAYGASMIKSACAFNPKRSKLSSTGNDDWSSTKRMISEYCLPTVSKKDQEDCIPYITIDGGCIDVLRHFIAIDRVMKTVVLAIRGTYSVSDLFIDVKGYTHSFCGGSAHKGIADRIHHLWENKETQDTITKALKENPEYDLILTGHSLGAGAACLLTIKLHHDRVFPETNIRCFAFAPPPVYLQSLEKNSNVDKAINNIAAFIHEKDCVPFLGIDSVRRLSDTLKKINNESSKWNIVKYICIATGLWDPPKSITEIVERGSEKLPHIKKGKRLAIPAPFIIWMHQCPTRNSNGMLPLYNAMFCRNDGEPDEGTTGVCDLSVYLDSDMISDHMIPKYMSAINSINAQIINGKTGYELP